MKQFIHAVTECPSKQNVGFYEAHFITNRDVIEAMHDTTKGFSYPKDDGNGGLEMGYQTNSQVLANLVVVFTKVPIDDNLFVSSNPFSVTNKLSFSLTTIFNPFNASTTSSIGFEFANTCTKPPSLCDCVLVNGKCFLFFFISHYFFLPIGLLIGVAFFCITPIAPLPILNP